MPRTRMLALSTIALAAVYITRYGGVAHAWSHHTAAPRIRPSSAALFRQRQRCISSSSSASIEWQRDHGRGEEHLSAFLDEGDVVIYQTGTWFVDGVEVGDGQPAKYEWAKIDNLQVVWSHNCEHGVLRGIALHQAANSQDKVVSLCETSPMEFIEFGPEQLVARVTVEWDDAEETQGTTLAAPSYEDLFSS